MHVVSFDLETFRFCEGALLPRPVCAQFNTPKQGEGSWVILPAWEDSFESRIADMLQDPEIIFVGSFIGFDFGVLFKWYPNLRRLIWDAYCVDRILDLAIFEKMLNLARYGSTAKIMLPDGTKKQVDISMGGLIKQYTGEDRSEAKESETRLTYHTLYEIPVNRWPKSAVDYCYDDVFDGLSIYENQKALGIDCPMLGPKSFSSFLYSLTSCSGIPTDIDARDELFAHVKDHVMTEERLKILFDSKILKPPVPSRPHKNGSEKMTKAIPSSRNMKVIKDLICSVYKRIGLDVPMTNGTEKNPKGNIKTDAETLKDIEGHDEALDMYMFSQEVQTLRSTDLPSISGPFTRGKYDPMINSSRISSYGNKKIDRAEPGPYKEHPYAARNVTNMGNPIRRVHRQPKGRVFVSCDYSGIELVTLAYTVKKYLGGNCPLWNMINSGVDVHGFFGSNLAMKWDESFYAMTVGLNIVDRMQILKAFQAMPKEFIKKFRTSGKIGTLGMPGGLGRVRIVSWAKSQYGVNISMDEGQQIRELYFSDFPEIKAYHKYVTDYMKDPHHPEKYHYWSPGGTYRSNVSFTETANGFGMQTPAAEGLLAAQALIMKDIFLDSSPLNGCRMLTTIHDEALMEMPEDQYLHDRVNHLETLMILGMQSVVDDGLPIAVESAAMRIWDKDAESIFDDKGRLKVWEPKSYGPMV